VDGDAEAGGRRDDLHHTFTDAAAGKPVDDLQPYLAAAGHVVVMHAEVTDNDGQPVFALPGQTFGPELDVQSGPTSQPDVQPQGFPASGRPKRRAGIAPAGTRHQGRPFRRASTVMDCWCSGLATPCARCASPAVRRSSALTAALLPDPSVHDVPERATPRARPGTTRRSPGRVRPALGLRVRLHGAAAIPRLRLSRYVPPVTGPSIRLVVPYFGERPVVHAPRRQEHGPQS
jgi:hypothetical protein